jgi:hypothetical protein
MVKFYDSIPDNLRDWVSSFTPFSSTQAIGLTSSQGSPAISLFHGIRSPYRPPYVARIFYFPFPCEFQAMFKKPVLSRTHSVLSPLCRFPSLTILQQTSTYPPKVSPPPPSQSSPPTTSPTLTLRAPAARQSLMSTRMDESRSCSAPSTCRPGLCAGSAKEGLWNGIQRSLSHC